MPLGFASRGSYLLTVLAGVLMALAPAPLNLWGLAWVSLAPLWLQVIQSQQSLRRILLHCGLWGFAYHGLTGNWLMGLHPLTWLGIPELASLGIVLICYFLVILWGTLFVWLWGVGLWAYGCWSQRMGIEVHYPRFHQGLRLLWGTALWCSLEALRNQSPLDWTPLAFTQSPGNLAILHLGQLSGPMTISAAIASVNGGWAETCSQIPGVKVNSTWRRWTLRPWMLFRLDRPTTAMQVGFSLTLAGILLFHGLGLGMALRGSESGFRSSQLHQGHQPQNAARSIKIGIIQGNIPTREKLTWQGIEKAEARYFAGYSQLADQGVDLVITPEAALPVLWQPAQPMMARVLQMIRDRKVPLLLGTFIPRSGQTTQSLLALTADGRSLSHYDKVKLVPLGEYIPGEAWLGGLVQRLSSLSGSLSPGKLDQRLQTPVGQAAAGICFESAFSEVLRSQVAAGGEFIVIASNLDPYSEVLMAQVDAHDLMRAIESDRDLVRATNTGFSGAINHQGQVLWRSRSRVYETAAVTISRRNTQTLYVERGDWLTPLLAGLSITTMGCLSLIAPAEQSF